MPTSAATVRRQTVVLGEKRFKRGVCAAMATAAAALRIGDILARDSNGRLVQCFASASSNTDSDANTKIAGIATFATDVPTVVGTEIDFMSAEDQLEFLLPLVVDTGSAPTAWSQAFEGKRNRRQTTRRPTLHRHHRCTAYAKTLTPHRTPLRTGYFDSWTPLPDHKRRLIE